MLGSRLLLAPLLVAVLVAGCTASPDDARRSDAGPPTDDATPVPSDATTEVAVVTSEGAKNFTALVEEFRATAAGLELPTGASFADPVRHDDGYYETGVGVGMAYTRWYCAWQEEWLTQRTDDAAAAAHALTVLAGFQDTDSFTRYFDQVSQDAFRAQVTAAAAGNPTRIAEDVELNC